MSRPPRDWSLASPKNILPRGLKFLVVKLGVAVGTTKTTVAAQDGPGDLAVHHFARSLTEPTSLAEFAIGGRPLRELRARIDAVVVAVPDGWLQQSTTGAWRRERLRQVIDDELGLPLQGVVSRTEAAAVALARPSLTEPA
jgi:hypothetical protein